MVCTAISSLVVTHQLWHKKERAVPEKSYVLQVRDDFDTTRVRLLELISEEYDGPSVKMLWTQNRKK